MMDSRVADNSGRHSFNDISRSASNKFIAAIRVHIKFRMVFYHFCHRSTLGVL